MTSNAPPRTSIRRPGAVRQEESVPLLAKIDAERQAQAHTVLPKSPLGDAVRYVTNQWAALQRFVEDGRLAIDNHRAENPLRVATQPHHLTGQLTPRGWRDTFRSPEAGS
jgi:hypothetical protein